MQIECIVSFYICPMKEKIDQIKQNQVRIAHLLDLYLKVKENEGRLYHLFADDVANKSLHSSEYKYYIANRETQQVVSYGTDSQVKSYMRIRNITSDDVMNDVRNFGDW